MKKNKFVRLDTDTHGIITEYTNKLTAIENKKLSSGEVVKRVMSGADILERLKLGSVERRKKK